MESIVMTVENKTSSGEREFWGRILADFGILGPPIFSGFWGHPYSQLG